MKKKTPVSIIDRWWRHLGRWDREQATDGRYLLENFDGETQLYLEATDNWWEELTDDEKREVYEEFFNENM